MNVGLLFLDIIDGRLSLSEDVLFRECFLKSEDFLLEVEIGCCSANVTL